MARPPLRCRMLLLGLGGLAIAAAAPAEVPLRTGIHAGFGRVVLDLPASVRYRLRQQADGLLVRVSGGVVRPQGAPPPHISAIVPEADGVLLRFAPGTRLHALRLRHHLVLDFSAPAAPRTGAQPLPLPSAAAPRRC